MIKKIIVFSCLFVLLLGTLSARRRIDYEGEKVGKALPEWIKPLLMGDLNGVSNILYPNEDKTLFCSAARASSLSEARIKCFTAIQTDISSFAQRFVSATTPSAAIATDSSNSPLKSKYTSMISEQTFTIEGQTVQCNTQSFSFDENTKVQTEYLIGSFNKGFDTNEFWMKATDFDESGVPISSYYEYIAVMAIDTDLFYTAMSDSDTSDSTAPIFPFTITNYFDDNEDKDCGNSISNICDSFGNILHTFWDRDYKAEKKDGVLTIKSIQSGEDLSSLKDNPLPFDVHEKLGTFIPESDLLPLLTKKNVGYTEIKIKGKASPNYQYYSIWEIDEKKLQKAIKRL